MLSLLGHKHATAQAVSRALESLSRSLALSSTPIVGGHVWLDGSTLQIFVLVSSVLLDQQTSLSILKSLPSAVLMSEQRLTIPEANTGHINYLTKSRKDRLNLIPGDGDTFADTLSLLGDYEGLSDVLLLFRRRHGTLTTELTLFFQVSWIGTRASRPTSVRS